MFRYDLFTGENLALAREGLNEFLQENKKTVIDVTIEHVEKVERDDGKEVTRLLVKLKIEK